MSGINRVYLRAPFVQDNFLYYTKLMSSFLKRCKSFDFYASVRPITARQNHNLLNAGTGNHTSITNGPDRPRRYLDIVDNVTVIFTNPRLMILLKVLEESVCTLDAYAVTPLNTARSSTIMSMSPTRTVKQLLGASSGLSVYQNSGPKIRMDLCTLDGKDSIYAPVFIKCKVVSESIPESSTSTSLVKLNIDIGYAAAIRTT